MLLARRLLFRARFWVRTFTLRTGIDGWKLARAEDPADHGDDVIVVGEDGLAALTPVGEDT